MNDSVLVYIYIYNVCIHTHIQYIYCSQLLNDTSHNLFNKLFFKNVLNFATVVLPANLLNLPSLKVLSLVKNINTLTDLEVPSTLLISFRTEIYPFSSPCFS